MPVYANAATDTLYLDRDTTYLSSRWTFACWLYFQDATAATATANNVNFGCYEADTSPYAFTKCYATGGPYLIAGTPAGNYAGMAWPFASGKEYYVALQQSTSTFYVLVYDRTAESWSSTNVSASTYTTFSKFFIGAGRNAANTAAWQSTSVGIEYAYARLWNHDTAALFTTNDLDVERDSTSAVDSTGLIFDEVLASTSSLGVFTNYSMVDGSHDFALGSSTSVAPLAMSAYSRMRNG